MTNMVSFSSVKSLGNLALNKIHNKLRSNFELYSSAWTRLNISLLMLLTLHCNCIPTKTNNSSCLYSTGNILSHSDHPKIKWKVQTCSGSQLESTTIITSHIVFSLLHISGTTFPLWQCTKAVCAPLPHCSPAVTCFYCCCSYRII